MFDILLDPLFAPILVVGFLIALIGDTRWKEYR